MSLRVARHLPKISLNVGYTLNFFLFAQDRALQKVIILVVKNESTQEFRKHNFYIKRSKIICELFALTDHTL
jgi:hypothetical protein